MNRICNSLILSRYRYTDIAWWWGIMVCLTLPACAGMQSSADQSAAQIKAVVSDKNSNVACSILPTPWGAGRVLVASVDETSTTNAIVTVKGDCTELSISTTKPDRAVLPKVGP